MAGEACHLDWQEILVPDMSCMVLIAACADRWSGACELKLACIFGASLSSSWVTLEHCPC